MALRIKKVNRKALLKRTSNSKTGQALKRQFQMMKEAMWRKEINYVVDLRFED